MGYVSLQEGNRFYTSSCGLKKVIRFACEKLGICVLFFGGGDCNSLSQLKEHHHTQDVKLVDVV